MNPTRLPPRGALSSRRRSPSAGILSALIASTLAWGCASYRATPLDTRYTASSVIDQREAQGLYIAVRDLSSASDSEKYFDRDLVEAGYVPVLVLLELDRESTTVFDLRREDLKLCLPDGTRLRTVDPTEVCEDVSFSHLRSTLGFLLIFPGFFVASSVNSANDELETDYHTKALESVRINPNLRSFRGVAFFKIPREQRRDFSLEEAFVEAKVYMGGGVGTVGRVLEFPVHFGR